uniref:Uncharacterized protein n=1 Tax=Rhizophora mucronata TaxID=61149 RepID=A0A2P2NUB4_RHIMU
MGLVGTQGKVTLASSGLNQLLVSRTLCCLQEKKERQGPKRLMSLAMGLMILPIMGFQLEDTLLLLEDQS